MISTRSARPMALAWPRSRLAACGGHGGSGKTFRIAMIAKSSTNPVFLSARTGADSAAKELSDAIRRPRRRSTGSRRRRKTAQVQAQRIAEAVNDGDNAILISASDASKVTGAIDDAVARGVPVMMFDSDAPDSKRFSFYGGDDEAMGRQVMSELAAQMHGKGKVAILAGNQNAPNLQKRVQGVKDEAAQVSRHHHRQRLQSHRDAAGRGRRSAARADRQPRHRRAGR